MYNILTEKLFNNPQVESYGVFILGFIIMIILGWIKKKQV